MALRPPGVNIYFTEDNFSLKVSFSFLVYYWLFYRLISKKGIEEVEASSMPSSISSDGSIEAMDCRLCRENACDVNFQPCGHSVTCYECVTYFSKCFACEVGASLLKKQMQCLSRISGDFKCGASLVCLQPLRNSFRINNCYYFDLIIIWDADIGYFCVYGLVFVLA